MSESLLVVDDDASMPDRLAPLARARGLDVVGVRTPEEAAALMASRSFGVAVVGLPADGAGSALIRALRQQEPPIESIVVSSDDSLSASISSHAHDVFAFLPRSADAGHMLVTIDRALERRRATLERQRLTWELGLFNEMAAIVASSLDIEIVMQRAAERIASAFQAEFVFVRLRPGDRGEPRVVAAVGADRAELERALNEGPGCWPGDRTLRDGEVIRLSHSEDQALAGAGGRRWRSAITVPVAVSGDILGAIAIASMDAERFAAADERFLNTIGRQIGVAVTNGQLYERVHRAKVEWERTFDAISDPIVVFDRHGRTMRVNAALAELRGWRITETQGRTCAEVALCGGAFPDCVVGAASRENRSIHREVATGDGRVFSVTTLPVTGRSGTVVQFAKEVTEERQRGAQLRQLSQELSFTNAELVSALERLRSTQAQLVQSEKLSAIGLLVAGVAHELNNPLTSIIGYAQLVHEDLAARPELAGSAALSEDVSRILSESDRAARIVRNLLTFARRQTSERGRQDLADLCARVVQLRAYECRLNGIDVVTEFAADLPPVFADGGELQQALLNLVLNAEQAMKDSAVKRIHIGVSDEPACGAVLIEVRDTGHGIDPANLRRVFDPFFTTRGVGEGTGLGLSIAYGIVRDHGGEIWADSVPDKRTSFFIRLPARVDSRPAERVGAVLVAHADSMVRDFLSAVFAGWGFPVRSAATLRESLESLAEDELGLAVIDRSVIEPDPARWYAAWKDKPRRTVMLAILSASVDDDTLRFLREQANVVMAPPHDLHQIRRALLAAIGRQS